MAKTKLKLEYIENEKARKMTFKKRANGVAKKTEELSVLCGVEACAIIYGPYDEAPVIWPKSEDEVKGVITDFKQRPEDERGLWEFNQRSFVQESVTKADDRLQRLQRRNREYEIENLATDIMVGKVSLRQVPRSYVRDLLRMLTNKCKDIDNRIALLNSLPPVGGGDIGIGAVVAQRLSHPMQ